jgi:ABC-type branched-subunit amino acid transport system ATPase component
VAGAASALGIVFVIFDRNLHLGSYYALFSGASLILTVVLNPVGIAGKTRADVDKQLAARAAKRKARQPAPVSLGEEFGDNATRAVAGARNIGDVVLRTAGVSVKYGGLVAVNDVTIEVRAGEIVGLIGPNGAGKTSFIDAITGFTPCLGEVYLSEERVSALPAHQRARRGLVRTWQSVELFEDLSASSNVRVSDDIGRDGWKFIRDMFRPNPPPTQAVHDAIALMSLGDVADRRPSELPLGRQKALGVARSLVLKPKVLLLDEPAAGLDTVESVAFGDHLKQIAATGVACLLIDHDMHLVLGVCDRIYVIEFGTQIADGRPDEVRRDPVVVAAYLGSSQVNDGVVVSRPDRSASTTR